MAVPTGFPSFDDLSGGLHPGNLIMLGGLPGVGKTAFALNVAAHAALRAQVPTLVFSLDLSKPEAMNLILASESDADAERLRAGLNEASAQEAEVSSEASRQAAPRVIEDTPAPTLDDLQAKLDAFLLDERMFPKGSVGQLTLMVIDGVRGVGPRRRIDPSERRIAKVMCGLKELAKKRQVAVLATSALNGNLYRREDRRPRPSDLDRSGTSKATRMWSCSSSGPSTSVASVMTTAPPTSSLQSTDPVGLILWHSPSTASACGLKSGHKGRKPDSRPEGDSGWQVESPLTRRLSQPKES